MKQKTLGEYQSDDVECPTCGDTFDTDRAMKAHHQGHDQPYYEMVVERELGLTPTEFIKKYHHKKNHTVAETGEVIGASPCSVRKMADRHDIDLRDQSKAKEVMWEEMDESEYGKFLDAPHEQTREMVNAGNHTFQNPDFERVQTEEFWEMAGDGENQLQRWRENNPEKHKLVGKENGALGAEARERNGMAGVTGQDNPNWRGGKNIYDAVKKQLPGPSWRQLKDEAKDRDGRYCRSCGAIGCKLDSHHIVPVLSGGTNGFWNLMTLCESCHKKAEEYIRQYAEFDPVLIE